MNYHYYEVEVGFHCEKHCFVKGKDGEVILYRGKKVGWGPGGYQWWEWEVGFDSSEPPGSPYRYYMNANSGKFRKISKKKAEEIIQEPIDGKEIRKLLKTEGKKYCTEFERQLIEEDSE